MHVCIDTSAEMKVSLPVFSAAPRVYMYIRCIYAYKMRQDLKKKKQQIKRVLTDLMHACPKAHHCMEPLREARPPERRHFSSGWVYFGTSTPGTF